MESLGVYNCVIVYFRSNLMDKKINIDLANEYLLKKQDLDDYCKALYLDSTRMITYMYVGNPRRQHLGSVCIVQYW